LTRSEGQWATQMLAWTRQDLLDLARDLSPTQLERSYPGERWNIAGILRHVATAEWWYLERLDMAGLDRKEIAADPFEALKQVRTRLAEALPNLEGMSKVVGKDGEFWSPRKVVRRALWHERDHTFHILKLLQND
jgi:uncharacterized damage-inducible protein DinB